MKKVIVVILGLAFQAVVFAAEPKEVSFTFEDNLEPVSYEYTKVEKIMKTSQTIKNKIGDAEGDTSPIPLLISKKSFDALVELSQRPSHNFEQHVRDIVFAGKRESLYRDDTITELTDLAALLDAADFLDFDSNNSVAKSIYSLMKSYDFHGLSYPFNSIPETYSFLSNEAFFNRLSGIKNKLFAYPLMSRLLSITHENLWDFLSVKTEIPYKYRSFGGDYRSAIGYDSHGALLGTSFEDNRIMVTNLDTGALKHEQAVALSPGDIIISTHLLNQGAFLAVVINPEVSNSVNRYKKIIVLYDLEKQTVVNSFDIGEASVYDISLVNNGQTLIVNDQYREKITKITFSQNYMKKAAEQRFNLSRVGDTQGRQTIYSDDLGLKYTKDDLILNNPTWIDLTLKERYMDLLAYDSEKDLIAAGSTKTNQLYLISPERLWIHQTTIPVANLSKIMFNPQGTKLAGVTSDRSAIIEWDISQLISQMNSPLLPEQILLLVIAHYLYQQATQRTESHLRIDWDKYPHLKKIYDTLPKRLQEQTVAWFDWSDVSTSYESSPLQLEEQEHGFKVVPVHTHADEDESSKNVGWMSWLKRFFKKK